MSEDPRIDAARYRAAQAARDAGMDDDTAVEVEPDDSAPRPAVPTAADRAAYVETAIQQAIRRGDFDDLPGAGKPLEGLGDHHDPDWWIRRKIQTEQLTGLGPAALILRSENAAFADRIDDMTRESEVREYIEDFNRRIIAARRQLLGGPPVVTPTRDVDAEVSGWRARRSAPPIAERPSAEPHGLDRAQSDRAPRWPFRRPGRRAREDR